MLTMSEWNVQGSHQHGAHVSIPPKKPDHSAPLHQYHREDSEVHASCMLLQRTTPPIPSRGQRNSEVHAVGIYINCIPHTSACVEPEEIPSGLDRLAFRGKVWEMEGVPSKR